MPSAGDEIFTALFSFEARYWQKSQLWIVFAAFAYLFEYVLKKKYTPQFEFGINHVGGYKSKAKSIRTFMKNCTATTQKAEWNINIFLLFMRFILTLVEPSSY